MSRSCGDWQLAFWMAVDGELPEADSKELAAHLRDCGACRDAVRSAARTHRVLVESTLQAPTGRREAAPMPQKPATRRTARSFRAPSGGSPWRAALIAAAVLFGLLGILYFSSGPAGSPEDPSARARRDAEARRNELIRNQARAEQARRESEARIEALRRDQARLEDERKKAPAPPTEDLRKKADEEFAEITRKRKEEEAKLSGLKEQEEAARKELAKEPGSKQDPIRATEVLAAAVARIDAVDGEAYRTTQEDRAPAAPGSDLLAGQEAGTVGAASRLRMSFADKTQVELGGDSILEKIGVEKGKRLVLSAGTLRAVVSKQPKDEPMIIVTPYGEATVVGTTLRLLVEPDPKKGARLEVEEGLVKFKDLAGKTVEVPSGFYAVAATGTEFAPKPLPIDEILLVPNSDEKRMKRIGGEWRLVKDPNAATGTALEVPAEFQRSLKTGVSTVEQIPSYVLFTFNADGDRDYFLWVRGQCMAASDRPAHDSVVVQSQKVRMTKPDYANADLGMGPDRAMLNGYGRAAGYWWIGGDADPYDAQGNRVFGPTGAGGRPGDETPTVVRFAKSGPQVLRLYAYEAPIRIDAIWLSTTQKTRPDPSQRGPVGSK